MFRPEAMTRVNILALDRHVSRLTEALGAAGVVHLSDPALQSPKSLLGRVERRAEISALESRLYEVRSLMETLRVDPVAPGYAPDPDASDLADRLGFLADLNKAVEGDVAALETLGAELEEVRQQQTRLRQFPCRLASLAAIREVEHVCLFVGTLPGFALAGVTEKLKGRAYVAFRESPQAGQMDLTAIASRKSRFSVEADLNKAGFRRAEIDANWSLTAEEELRNAEARESVLKKQFQAHVDTLRALGLAHGQRLGALGRRLELELALRRAEERFGRTARVYCVSGWIQSSQCAHVERLVAEATEGGGLIRYLSPDQDPAVRAGRDRVPVKLPSNRFLLPFQQLVQMYGMPSYAELDPSPFVAVAYILMFGMMFGDVGHGAVFAGVGLWFRSSRKPAIRKLRSAGTFLMFCGASAMVFGLAYGSLFGKEGILPHLWINPLEKTMLLFGVAVALGVICISMAMVFNIINRFRSRRFFDGVVDKFGVTGLILYWGALAFGIRGAITGTVDWRLVALVVGVPLVVLFLHEPLHRLRHRERLFQNGFPMFLMMASMEMMEVFSSFVGNTISFVRVGAFALSHVALCLSVYAVAELVRSASGGGLWTALVVVFGNLLVLCLEGMVVVIQGLRLVYYEFFGKFFNGDGLAYRPFRLACVGLNEEETES